MKTHILCSIIFSENHAVCEIMWKNLVGPDRPQKTVLMLCRKDVLCMPDNQGKNAGVSTKCFHPQEFVVLLNMYIFTFQTYQCHNKVTSDFVFLGSCSMVATTGHSSESKNVALWDSLLPQKKALITGTYFLLYSRYVMFSYGVSLFRLLFYFLS